VRAKEEWRIEADQVAQFMGDRCEMLPDARVASVELYLAYKNWAVDAGITRQLNRKNFTNRVLRRGGQLCKGTGGVRMIAGVRLKSMVEGDGSDD
jgi:putative DNA primase/helicase